MKERTKKIMKVTAAGLVAAVVLMAAVAVPYSSAAKRGGVVSDGPGGMTFGSARSEGVTVVAAEIPKAEYESYGVMPIAETAYTLTATVNEDATRKAVDWTVEFANPSSQWATGKTVTEYVTATSSGDLTATVQCLKAFGEQILVSAVSKDDPQVKATCTCDYQKSIATITLGLYNDEYRDSKILEKTFDVTSKNKEFVCAFDYNKTYYYKATFDLGLGTIDPMMPVGVTAYVTLRLNDQAREKFIAAGYDPGEISEYSFTYHPNSGIVPYLSIDRNFVTTLYGDNAFSGETFYNALQQVNRELNSATLDLILSATTEGEHVEITHRVGLKAGGLYTAVSNVQVDESSLLFGAE